MLSNDQRCRRLSLARTLHIVQLLLGAAAAGCADDSAASPQVASLDSGSVDASADVAAEAAPEASDALDEATADADAGSKPFAHCQGQAQLADWTSHDGAAATLTATCAQPTLSLTALHNGALRLSYNPAGASLRSFAIDETPGADSSARAAAIDDTRAELCTQWLRAEVSRDGCRLRVIHADGDILLEDPLDGGFSTSSKVVEGKDVAISSLTRSAAPAESFYGFGEKTGPLNKRGRKMVFWNTDPYDSAYGGYAADADPLYASIPFFIGLRGSAAYGIFTDNSHRIEVDVAASDVDRYRIDVFDDDVVQYVIPGPTMQSVIARYTDLTGRMKVPPLWSLGFHQCRWGYSPSEAFEGIGAQLRARKIPSDALWLDIQHMDGYRTFTWDPAAFADPQAMIGRLRSEGFNVVVIADPGIKQDPGWSIYDEGAAGDLFLKNPDGSQYVGVVWPGNAVFPDFSMPEARGYWGRHIGALADQGVRGVWLDVNEPTVFPESGGGSMPNDVPAHGDGVPATMAEVHNAYALLEARATYEGLMAAAPKKRPFILTRAAYAGTQRYAAVWTGDAPSRWSHLEQTLPMLLNMGISGLAFVGSDVGGYSGNATPELYARWMALGSVSPFFRAHVTSGVPGQEPWQFGPEVEDISRALIEQRYRLLPYLYSLFAEASQSGLPILRPMVLDFQSDAQMRDVGDQAMLGPFLLAAPVLGEGELTRTVRLPEGRWYEYHSGAAYEGPSTVTVDVTLAALPLFVREGAIIPTGPVMQHTGQQPLAPLYLELYPSGEQSSFALYEDARDGFEHETSGAYARTTYQLQRVDGGAKLTVAPREGTFQPPERALVIRLRRVDHGVGGVRINGAPLGAYSTQEALLGAGSGYFYDERDLSAVIVTKDGDDFTLEVDYDGALVELSPPVAIKLRVTVPEGTPQSPPIHIASSVAGWTHQPLEWSSSVPNQAEGWITVPRGQWFYYKYTRGSWDKVEKWPGCEEATNRYGFGAAHPDRGDVVYQWSDWCP